LLKSLPPLVDPGSPFTKDLAPGKMAKAALTKVFESRSNDRLVIHAYQRQSRFGYSATHIDDRYPRLHYGSRHPRRIAAYDDPIASPCPQPTGRPIVDVPRFKTEHPRAMLGCVSSYTFDNLSPVSTRCLDQQGYVRSLIHDFESMVRRAADDEFFGANGLEDRPALPDPQKPCLTRLRNILTIIGN
jgi:hypothetical protein